MRILTIGGGGFVGRFVVDQLRAEGHDVAVFSRSGDIRGDRHGLAASAPAIRRFAPDLIVDLILSSGPQAEALMAIASGLARRVVAISSIDVYRACGILHRLDDGPLEPVPLTETSPLRTRRQTYPPQELATLKSTFEWLDDEYDKIAVERRILGDPRTPGTVLRLPMVYGPGDRLHRLAPLVSHMDRSTDAVVLPESLARWRAPRGYVENVAHAVTRAVAEEGSAGRIYNVAEPQNFSEGEWTGRVARAIGWTGRVRVVPDSELAHHPLLRGNLAQHWSADTTRIRRELGYHEIVGVDESIRRTAAWERAVRVSAAGA